MVGHFLAFISEIYYYLLLFISFSLLLYIISKKILVGHENGASPLGVPPHGPAPDLAHWSTVSLVDLKHGYVWWVYTPDLKKWNCWLDITWHSYHQFRSQLSQSYSISRVYCIINLIHVFETPTWHMFTFFKAICVSTLFLITTVVRFRKSKTMTHTFFGLVLLGFYNKTASIF